MGQDRWGDHVGLVIKSDGRVVQTCGALLQHIALPGKLGVMAIPISLLLGFWFSSGLTVREGNGRTCI